MVCEENIWLLPKKVFKDIFAYLKRMFWTGPETETCVGACHIFAGQIVLLVYMAQRVSSYLVFFLLHSASMLGFNLARSLSLSLPV